MNKPLPPKIRSVSASLVGNSIMFDPQMWVIKAWGLCGPRLRRCVRARRWRISGSWSTQSSVSSQNARPLVFVNDLDPPAFAVGSSEVDLDDWTCWNLAAVVSRMWEAMITLPSGRPRIRSRCYHPARPTIHSPSRVVGVNVQVQGL